MVQQRPRWRSRISTPMFLVIILALALAWMIERRRMEQELQRARAELAASRAESARLITKLQKALDASQGALAKVQRTEDRSEASARTQGAPKETPGPPKVECHLDVAVRSGTAPGDFRGEFTLKNTSAEPVRIGYYTHPTVGLVLDVRDEKGKTLPRCIEAYGMIYSPHHPGPDVLTIKPGEAYRTPVGLFNQVDRETHPVTPGKYTVEAAFAWWTPSGTASSVKSNTVTIEVTAK